MESRLPKPSALKRPGTVAKTVLPTDRIKAAAQLRNGLTNRLPLTRDLTNLTAALTTGSPEIQKTSSFPARARLRRSRSACDIREIENPRPLKRTETTLAPIPSKSLRLASSNSNLTSSGMPGLTRNVLLSTRTRPLLAAESSTSSISSGSTSGIRRAATVPASKTAVKRIPPYDYKARYNDLLEKHKVLKDKFDEAKEQLGALDTLPEQYEECQSELIVVKEALKNSKTEVECLRRQSNSQNIKIDSLTKCLHDTQEEFDRLKEKYEFQCNEQEAMLHELKDLRERCAHLTELTTTQTDELEACREQLFRANMERKELHNAVMDLRGNIRVFCRVRPPLPEENDRLLCGWNYIDESTLEIYNLELLASGAKNKVANHEFSFDHVFHPRSTQDDVFELVSPLIQSAMDGYNVCIFAYGQTGSGKTFTMDGVPDKVGVIPRTVDLLFESIRNYKRLGWEYEIKVTFLEIYNEVLYDLLSNDQKNMEIRMGSQNKNDIYVSNITEETVTTANRLRQLMQIAKMNRATAATVGNERSSRSHAVTRIELIGSHEAKSEISIGTINLVDLAGSESPKTSIRMNETKNINRSLSELTNVILALLQKQDHIPYRNSKLTHLLMPSLGGNSKTLMFINVSPFQDCFVESVKSLRFAASVNSCKLAKAKKNRYLNSSNNSLTM